MRMCFRNLQIHLFLCLTRPKFHNSQKISTERSDFEGLTIFEAIFQIWSYDVITYDVIIDHTVENRNFVS